MTPAIYFDSIVLPTVREFLAARGDRRLAYLACISAYHLCDYVARANGTATQEARAPLKAACQPSFDVVEGICNGSKHCGRDGRGAFDHTPGTKRDVPGFGWGIGGGWGHGRWGGIPGLKVNHNGRKFLVDECLLDFLRSAAAAYPTHLSAAAQIDMPKALPKP